MLHYLHLANTCFWWKDLPTIMRRTAEVVIIFPLSSMMFFWHSSVTRRVPVVPVELPSLYICPWPIAIYIGSMSNPEIHFPLLQDSPKQHKPFSSFHPTAGKSIIWNFMMDPLCILYQDMLMCSCLKNFLTGTKISWLIFQTPRVSFDSQKTSSKPHWSFRHHIELPGSGWSTGGLLAKSTRFDFTKGIALCLV